MSILLIITLALLVATAADTRLSQTSGADRRQRSNPPRTTPRHRASRSKRSGAHQTSQRSSAATAKWWWE